MKTGPQADTPGRESGAVSLIEYITVSGVLLVLMMVLLLQVNSTFIETPVNTLTYIAFTDIGNGVSTRIVDIYAIAPDDGIIVTDFDLPDDVADKNYNVVIGKTSSPIDEDVEISQGIISTNIALAGIGASRGVSGNTTGAGVNRIIYDSGGFGNG